MDLDKQKDIFRLAAVLYADNNYEVSPKTIHRKIIESVFLDNNNAILTISELLEWLENNYNFVFDFSEIETIVTAQKEENFLLGRSKEEITVCLSQRRIELLKSKIHGNNIDYFIDNFFKEQNKSDAPSLKNIIYKFLYELFSTNISSFSKLLNSDQKIDELINVANNSFNPLEIDIINSFLQWDNDDKNKAIFDISSYALEYCLITNKNSGSSFHLDNLKNKQFYLDTNIIFRAIGINGENRKNRTRTFLKKFTDAGETLLLSRFSDFELKATIKYYVAQLAKSPLPKVSSKTFLRYVSNSDFFDFYHTWRIGRSNDNLELFEIYILNEVDQLKKHLNIVDDYNLPFDEKDNKIKERLDSISSSIYSFKNGENLKPAYYEGTLSDAKNILLIEKRRNGQYKNVFETKYYFISSDQALRRWDYVENKSTPTVIMPSQWLSILLRYIQRSNDDFKSFVSFLNLSQNETKLSNENLHLILSGISEITQDFEQQSSIIGIMMDAKFRGVLEKNNTDQQTIENSRNFAKTKLERDLEEIKKQNEALGEKFASHKKNTTEAIKNLKELKTEERTKKIEKESENNRLKKELREQYINKKIFLWRMLAYCLFPIVVLIVLFYILLFCCSQYNWNVVCKLGTWINTLPEGSLQKETAKYIYLLPLGALIPALSVIYNRLIRKEKKREKIKKIEEILPEHIRIKN